MVAVSGGRESTALAAALSQAVPGDQVHLAHVHHHLRERDADLDQECVENLAERLGLPLHILHVDVARYRARHRLSTLVAARYARYQVLGSLLTSLGGQALVTAHTRTDQQETVLNNALRGSHVRGLVGMLPQAILSRTSLGPPLDPPCVPEWPFLTVERPLLEIQRLETAAYCRSHRLPYRDDVSNLNLHYRRARLREHLLPALNAVAPGAEGALDGLSEMAAQTMTRLDQRLAIDTSAFVRRSSDSIGTPLAMLQGIGSPLRSYLLVEAWRAVAEHQGELGRVHVAALERLVDGMPGIRQAHLPGGILAERRGDWLTFRRHHVLDLSSEGDDPLTLAVPGCVTLADGRTVSARIERRPSEFTAGEAGSAWIDCSVGSSLRLRHPRPGDRFRPLGAQGGKPLAEVLTDRKVPLELRARLVLLETTEGVAWVEGLRVAEFARVCPGARDAIRVRVDQASVDGEANGSGRV